MHTDLIMKNVWLNLARDFRSALGDPTFLRTQEATVKNILTSPQQFRECDFPEVMQAPVYVHKIVYQMKSLYKRYIFSNDVRPSVLGEKSISDFIAFQASLQSPRCSYSTNLVLSGARKIVKDILGPFDDEEHAVSCRFGSRANRGVPKRLSYLDVKVTHPSGSSRHWDWFANHLNGDDMLAAALSSYHVKQTLRPGSELDIQSQPGKIFADLAITAVPKSWKATRIIVPNTVIGAFHSYGLGQMIAKRLKENAGLDIQRLQHIHGRLAQKASITRRYVTADLSKASDSFTYELVARLVPRPWFNKLKEGRIDLVSHKGRMIKLRSFMAMGIGYTFPLQTLLFYALIKSIQNLLGLNYRVSVYGDDLIYHRSLHKYVVAAFADVGFNINTDKTFVDQHFRESCGHDFYRGVDVRPFQPEFVGSDLRGRKLSAYLYKLVNGLARRWEPEEIPQTFWYLFRLIASHDGLVYQVPPSFPDYAGVKVGMPQNTWYVPWSPVGYNRNLSFKFRALQEVAGDRYVMHLDAYYWSWHRSKALEDCEVYIWNPLDRDDVPSAVQWRATNPKRRYRSRLTGRRTLKTVPVVPSKVVRKFSSSLQVIPTWI